MKRLSFLAATLLFTSSLVPAQTTPNPSGIWSLKLGPRTVMLLTLNVSHEKDRPYTGTLTTAHFQTSDFSSFSNVHGPAKEEPIIASAWKGHDLSITVQNPADPKDTDTYLLSQPDMFHVELRVEGLPIPPIRLTHEDKAIPVATDWDPTKTYSTEDDLPSNPEMKRIFDEDQRVRQSYPAIDWTVVSKSDAERRNATLKLLSDGALHSGEDFTWAAFIFQHGNMPDDYLLAHTLAMIAVRRGEASALWIATATLDRYLQSIKQPQIYGTQFLTPNDKPVTQEPYNRTLISDSLRHQLGVPPLADQEQQRKVYEEQNAKK